MNNNKLLWFAYYRKLAKGKGNFTFYFYFSAKNTFIILSRSLETKENKDA